MCAAISATCGLDAIRLEIKAGMLIELASREAEAALFNTERGLGPRGFGDVAAKGGVD